jgi:hypothetical protein
MCGLITTVDHSTPCTRARTQERSKLLIGQNFTQEFFAAGFVEIVGEYFVWISFILAHTIYNQPSLLVHTEQNKIKMSFDTSGSEMSITTKNPTFKNGLEDGPPTRFW